MPLIGKLELALAPMLGCFGVAPPRGQAISTATSGEYDLGNVYDPAYTMVCKLRKSLLAGR